MSDGWVLAAMDGKEFVETPHLINRYWDYMDEYFLGQKDEVDWDVMEKRVAGLLVLMVYKNDEFVSFSLIVDNKAPGPQKDFFMGDFYVVPKHRGVDFLHWFRCAVRGILLQLGYDTWSMAIPADNHHRTRSYSRLGFDDIEYNSGHAIMTMDLYGGDN